MVRLTVGVPVYNGASSIRTCLQNLADQDCDDFQVLISDNASTDGTSEICAEFADQNPRFSHYRHPENRGAMPNFFWLRDNAQSPLFAWRAHDDWSSPDYLSRLVGCFDADPEIWLAVGTIITRSYRVNGDPRVNRFPYPGPNETPSFLDLCRLLYREKASWIYGVWNREALTGISMRIWDSYPDVWGYDHLCVCAAILAGQVRGHARAEFTQHMDQRPRDHNAASPTSRGMLDLRHRFGSVLYSEIDRANWNTPQRLALKLFVPVFMDHRLDHRRRIYKTLLRERLGLK